MKKKRILVLATGGKTVELGGGSGFMEMAEFSRTNPPILDADIAAVASNYSNGGVWQKADKLKVPFVYFPAPFTAERYRRLVKETEADFVMCSGWTNLVQGLDPRRTINIHPAPLPGFGGPGMYGHHVHDAVIKAMEEDKINQSAVSMHFVVDRGPNKTAYDKGPVFFKMPVLIRQDDTAETLAKRVNEKERAWQSHILNLVVNGHIWLGGIAESWQVYADKKFTGEIPGFTGRYI